MRMAAHKRQALKRVEDPFSRSRPAFGLDTKIHGVVRRNVIDVSTVDQRTEVAVNSWLMLVHEFSTETAY
jgi:hypothetical protein